MGILFKKVSERIFELLKGQKYKVSLYDEAGNRVYDVEEARMFFANPNKMMLNIVDDDDDSTIRVNISKNQDIEQIKHLLTQLRQAATHFGLMFTIRQYARELRPKDFAFLAVKPVEESTSLKLLPKYIEQETITEEIATWATLFSKLDRLMEHPKAKDSAYLEQAENWTNGTVTESDDILNRIISTINEQSQGSRQAKWFKGETRIKLEGIMAMAKKKITEVDGNWDAYNRHDDRMVSAEQEWEDYVSGFDPEDFAQYVLNDITGYTHASQVPVTEKQEVQELLDDSLPTVEAVARYLDTYISKQTDGRIEDAGMDLVDSTFEGFAKCGFNIPPMDINPNSELKAFESWVKGFDPAAIIKTQQIKESAKLKQTKQQIVEMREKIAKAKSNKELMEKKVFQDQKNKLFDVAHAMSAHRNEPYDLRNIAEKLTESEILSVLEVIADVWEPTVAEDIKQTLDQVVLDRELARERIAEAKRVDRTIELGDSFHTEDLRKLAGLTKLNESWTTPQVMTPPLEQNANQSIHKQRLLADIKKMILQLGMEDDGSQVTDGEGGAFIYVTWSSPDCRTSAETALSGMGHQVNRDYWIGSNTSEIPVDVYQGYDAQVNPMEFSEALDANGGGVSVFMEQPYKRDLVDAVHDKADELGFKIQPYYPDLANGLIFKCSNEFQANELIAAAKTSGINLYVGANEALAEYDFDDGLLDSDFDDDELFGSDLDDEEDEDFDEGRLEIKHFDDDGEETVKVVDESEKPKLHSTNNGWRIQKKGKDFIVKKGMITKHFKNTPYSKVLSWTNVSRPGADKVVDESNYKPGVTVLVRSMAFNDDHDWEIVKNIKWPYGVQVRFNDVTREVTWKTAKMKTVANILEKNIDFDATSARDLLELPADLLFNGDIDEASLLGANMTPDAKARDTEESDSEYIHQKQFKRKWKQENPGKTWPGYSSAGYKHPKYKMEDAHQPKNQMQTYAIGYYLYSTIGSDQAEPVLTAYGSFKNLFDASNRISQMDDIEEDGVAVCYYDGEHFRPTKGNKILRQDLSGAKLPSLNKNP